ncbi:protein FAF-like, chloroplastic [Mercurialis annua]|uniref:protein FAF-like, chloroplastic n=1 Tax=Mercurialis annua TaxID=3986 RepID=UPI00215F38F1|nr:protein FAF-like, chloroplastic [Mercurialis annua]
MSSSLISLKPEAMGIVSILGSDSEKPKPLRRTLSADMSSNNYGVSGLKRIASSGEFPKELDVWSSILSQKAQEEDNQTLYVHPLIKRSSSCLSEKSLEICTESLGSETGSDGLISPQDDIEEEEKSMSKYEMVVGKYNKKPSSAKLFPPPLSTLDGASLHMKPRRDNGRLVLEAVSVTAQNNFHAQRHQGRLVLTFVDQEEDAEEEDENFAVEEPPKLAGGLITVHRLAVMMNKPVVLSNMKLLSSSMPPTPTPFNAYEYYWKPKPVATAKDKNKTSSTEKQELIPLPKGCYHPKRSLLFWETYCIATS